MVQEVAGGQSLDEAQSEGGCQPETPINTPLLHLLILPVVICLSSSCSVFDQVQYPFLSETRDALAQGPLLEKKSYDP